MRDLKHTERLSRRQAAERLADVAAALVVGSAVVLRIDGEHVRVPDSDELVLHWDGRMTDGRLRLDLEVTWPPAGAADGQRSAGPR